MGAPAVRRAVDLAAHLSIHAGPTPLKVVGAGRGCLAAGDRPLGRLRDHHHAAALQRRARNVAGPQGLECAGGAQEGACSRGGRAARRHLADGARCHAGAGRHGPDPPRGRPRCSRSPWRSAHSRSPSRRRSSPGSRSADGGATWSLLGILPMFDPPRDDPKATAALRASLEPAGLSRAGIRGCTVSRGSACRSRQGWSRPCAQDRDPSQAGSRPPR
jgi:hypothetical protein